MSRTLIVAMLVDVGCWWVPHRLAQLDSSALAARIGTAGTALVEIEDQPRPGQFETRVRAQVLRWRGAPLHERVLLELRPGREPVRGARLSLLGTLRAPRGPTHGFDERAWLRNQGIHVVLRADAWHASGRRGGLAGLGDRLHAWLERDVAPGVRGDRAAVLRGVVLGETQGMQPALLDRFRASGLYHVLAVDGLKVAAVAGGIVGLVLAIGGDRYLAETGSLAGVGAYLLAVGAHASGIRAAIAAGLTSLGWLTARQRDRWHALLVAAVVLLAWNPYLVLDAGFQLSFAAVAGIFTIAPRVARACVRRGAPHGVAQLVGVSTACGLATAPVTWLQFHQVSLVTVPANVVGVPIVAEMLGVGLLTAVVAPVAPPLAFVLAQANGVGAAAVAAAARGFGALPGAQTASPGAALGAAACALLLAAYACRHGFGRAQARLPPDGDRPPEDRARAAPAA